MGVDYFVSDCKTVYNVGVCPVRQLHQVEAVVRDIDLT